MLAAVDSLVGAGVMPGGAIVKPSFAGRNWYAASVYQGRRGSVSWTDELPRAAVVAKIPVAAQQAPKVQDLIPF